MQPPIFPDVLGIAPALERPDRIVVFNEVERGDLPACSVQLAAPAEDGFRKGLNGKAFLLKKEGDEERILVYDDRSPAAKPLNDGDLISFDAVDVDDEFRLS